MRSIAAAFLLLPCAASAQPWLEKFPAAAIDRPLTLPEDTVELSLLAASSSDSGTSTGGSAALGVELGVGDGQAGIAVAVPAIPGFGFGSVVGSASYLIDPRLAFRVDLAFDHSQGDVGRPNFNFYALGGGLPAKLKLSPELALITGRVGAMGFAHFANLSVGGVGFYRGASLPFEGADLVVYTKQEDAGSQLMLQLPLGLVYQPARFLAITARAGYQVMIVTSGDGVTRHFLPLGLEAVVSAGRSVDVGASFGLAGEVQGGGSYADTVMGEVWLRVRP